MDLFTIGGIDMADRTDETPHHNTANGSRRGRSLTSNRPSVMTMTAVAPGSFSNSVKPGVISVPPQPFTVYFRRSSEEISLIAWSSSSHSAILMQSTAFRSQKQAIAPRADGSRSSMLPLVSKTIFRRYPILACPGRTHLGSGISPRLETLV